MKKLLVFCLVSISVASLLLTGCFGSFKYTDQIRQVESNSGNKILAYKDHDPDGEKTTIIFVRFDDDMVGSSLKLAEIMESIKGIFNGAIADNQEE